MKIRTLLISKKALTAVMIVATGVAVLVACSSPSPTIAHKRPPKLASDKDRASLSLPVLKRRGPLTQQELRNGAAPVEVHHRSIRHGSPLEHERR